MISFVVEVYASSTILKIYYRFSLVYLIIDRVNNISKVKDILKVKIGLENN